MSRKYQSAPYNPPKCWVGDKHKICYESEEDAEDAARLSEYQHGLPIYSLGAYHCDLGNHWHIANKKTQIAQQKAK